MSLQGQLLFFVVFVSCRVVSKVHKITQFYRNKFCKLIFVKFASYSIMVCVITMALLAKPWCG